MRSAAVRAPRDLGVRSLPAVALAVALGGVAGVLAFSQGRSAVEAVLIGGFGAVFAALAWCDLDRRIVPNRVVYPALTLALLLSFAWPDRGVVATLVGAASALGGALFVRLAGRGGLGMGDVKMMALVGAVVGYPVVLVAGFVTVVAGGFAAALLMLCGRVGRHAYIPYAPFIALGGLTALLR